MGGQAPSKYDDTEISARHAWRFRYCEEIAKEVGITIQLSGNWYKLFPVNENGAYTGECLAETQSINAVEGFLMGYRAAKEGK